MKELVSEKAYKSRMGHSGNSCFLLCHPDYSQFKLNLWSVQICVKGKEKV